MQTIILLSLVLITGFLFKKEKNPYSRIIIGSVFGIVFFSIWPFTVFYFDIHHLKEKHLIFLYVVFLMLAASTSLLLVKIKQSLVIAFVSFICFISLTIFTVSYKHEIKNKVAIYSGYFHLNEAGPFKNTTAKGRNIFSKFNYTFTLNKKWVKKSDKGSFFEYFILSDKNYKVAEFRPRCFNTQNISIPEIIENIKYSTLLNVNFIKNSCYQSGKTIFSCDVTELNNKKNTKRVRWFSIDTKIKYGIELDFITFKSQAQVKKEIKKIIDSAKFSVKKHTEYNCLTPTEWM